MAKYFKDVRKIELALLGSLVGKYIISKSTMNYAGMFNIPFVFLEKSYEISEGSFN